MYEPANGGNPLGDGTTAGRLKVGTLVREIVNYDGLLVDDRLAVGLQIRKP